MTISAEQPRRRVFGAEERPGVYVEIHARGAITRDALDAIAEFVARQRKRLDAKDAKDASDV